MKPMRTLEDLIDEAKVRGVWWGLCIFAISYFLSHTSKSMWMNVPMAILILFALRYLSYEVELRWKIRPLPRQTFLSVLQKEQLSLDDPRLSPFPPLQRWTRKIDSPVVETAVRDFIDKIVQDFVVDLWYAAITPDKDGPELIRDLILDAIGEISGRIKSINLVDLLTSDMVQLVGNHLDLFRKNQSIIGTEVMGTLSSEERDKRLKHHLMASKELHPALVSPESEYKVLQRLVEGVLAVVLEPRETPLASCLGRELLASLVLEPVMNLASPGYINELIEVAFLNSKDDKSKEGYPTAMADPKFSSNGSNFPGHVYNSEQDTRKKSTSSPFGELMLSSTARKTLPNFQENMFHEDSIHTIDSKPADWARMLDAATQRRTQVLAPENLDNMWTKGRNYQKKHAKIAKGSVSYDTERIQPSKSGSAQGWDGSSGKALKSTKSQLKRSSSTSDLRKGHGVETSLGNKLGMTVGPPELYNSVAQGLSGSIILTEDLSMTAKIKCRVVGAYFEKAGSNAFAVYSIAVTDAENKTWFVKRRYRNFERLHRHLKDIPNYTLHLPPKRFLSSSIDDTFVHQRCILLDKYLQDLLSIANLAEQHEVLDFLSTASKNYSHGKATSVIRTFAVNVDDAMDDIVRQFKGVSGGIRRVIASPPSSFGSSSLVVSEAASVSGSSAWNEDRLLNQERGSSDEEAPERGSCASISGWHSDNELDTNVVPHSLHKHEDHSISLDSQKSNQLEKNDQIFIDQDHFSSVSVIADSTITDPVEVPEEWSPPNVSVPILNLVDKIFQLNRRGWIRRQVFWISKQILQLMMEDAIDDWLLRQINWLRKDDVVAKGIRWLQDILWPNGTFFIKVGSSKESSEEDFQENQKSTSGATQVRRGARPLSFEEQLEATRRASDVKKMILGGAPTTLVSLIGAKQYKRCAKDVYYFLQSSICIKQLAYGMLEVVLVSLFPEMHDLVLDIHQSKQTQAA